MTDLGGLPAARARARLAKSDWDDALDATRAKFSPARLRRRAAETVHDRASDAKAFVGQRPVAVSAVAGLVALFIFRHPAKVAARRAAHAVRAMRARRRSKRWTNKLFGILPASLRNPPALRDVLPKTKARPFDAIRTCAGKLCARVNGRKF